MWSDKAGEFDFREIIVGTPWPGLAGTIDEDQQDENRDEHDDDHDE